MADRIIYKYPLEVTDMQAVVTRHVHKILSVQAQNGTPCLWIETDPQSEPFTLHIACFGTGNGSPEPDDSYIGTVQLNGFVWHYYQRQRNSLLRAARQATKVD